MWRRSLLVWMLVLPAGCKDKSTDGPAAQPELVPAGEPRSGESELARSRAEFEAAKATHDKMLRLHRKGAGEPAPSRAQLETEAAALDKAIAQATADVTEARTTAERDAARAQLAELQRQAAAISNRRHDQNTEPTTIK